MALSIAFYANFKSNQKGVFLSLLDLSTEIGYYGVIIKKKQIP